MSSLLWSEKYRPHTVDEMADHEEIKNVLNGFLKTGNITNCLFAGPSGTGKTTATLCLVRGLYGELPTPNFKEVNASDNRGINYVRYNIKVFAQCSAFGGFPYKIMLLDEADNIGSDAQWALRRTMEKFQASCRFILTINYPSKLIPAIRSRCTPFIFRPIPRKDAVPFLEHVAEGENVKTEAEALDMIYDNSLGDMRLMINALQSASFIGAVTTDSVKAVISVVNPDEIVDMLQSAISGDFFKARTTMYKLMYERALSGQDLIRQTFNILLGRLKLPEEQKSVLVTRLADIDTNISQGASDDLQMSAFLALCGSVK